MNCPRLPNRSNNLRYVYLVVLTLGLALSGCTIQAEPINFGQDQCHSCQMTIVDKQHASQAVTKKGKQLRYDSIECLVEDILKNKSEDDLSVIIISDYGVAQMTPADAATYLISPKIKSPMGANLSGFSSKDKALASQAENGGEIFTWQALKVHFTKQQP